MNYVIIHFNLLGLRKETLMKNFKWINVLKGFGMGTSDLVPGVSGGTIALLLGIYDGFISSISGLFSRRFWPSLKFYYLL